MMVVGIIISAHLTISFVNSLFQRTVGINNLILKPKPSTNVTAHFDYTVFPTTSVVLLSFPINYSYSELLTAQPLVSEIIVNSTEKIINSGIFTKDFFSTFEPKPGETYKLYIMNLDTEPAKINGLFGYLQFINNKGQLSSDTFKEISSGSVIFLVGFSLLLFGMFVRIFYIMKDPNWSMKRVC